MKYLLTLWAFMLYQKVASVLVSMRGGELITYEIMTDAEIHTDSLHVVFQFKTIDPSSLLLFSENRETNDYISVELLDGKLQYKARLGLDESGEQNMLVSERLNDYEWHTVDIQLYERNVTIELDYKKHFQAFGGEYKMLDLTERVYFGGVQERLDISSYNIIRRKYSGCLKGLMFDNMDILYNAKFSRPNYATEGNLKWDDKCDDIDFQPVMFTNPQDHAMLPTYQENSLSVSFGFRTHIGKGLMFAKSSKMVEVSLSLKDAKLYLEVHIGQGNGPIKMVQGENLDDGFWHRVEIVVDKAIIKFKLNDKSALTHHNPYSKLVSFHRSNATLGGGQEHIMQGFVGCMYNIWVDNTAIDYKKLHPAYSVGVVKKCQLTDQCLFSPCHNGGKCTQDHKSFKCDCFNTMYSGERCEKSIYQPSCQEYKDLGLSEDSYCVIDPDGDSDQVKPFQVLCNMTRFHNKAVTVFKHDLQGEIPVAKGEIEGGAFHYNINYKIELETFDVLMKNAIKCRQYVKFKCKNAFLMRSPRGPPDTFWVGRTGSNEEYWGGAQSDSGKCACGYDGSCARKYIYCNCDVGDDVWRSDEGFLNQTERLPVTMLSFKLSGNQSLFTVGDLECQFNSTAISPKLSNVRMLKACKPFDYKATTRTPVTDLSLNQKESVINWRRLNKPSEFGDKSTKHVILPAIPKVNVNVTVEIPKQSQGERRPQDGLKFTLSVYAVIVIAVATVIVVIIIAIVVIAKRCQGHPNNSRRRNDSLDMEEEREETTEMCTFFGSFSHANSNQPVIEVHRHSIHCETLDELPPAYRELTHDYINQPITTHIDLSYKPRKKNFGVFC